MNRNENDKIRNQNNENQIIKKHLERLQSKGLMGLIEPEYNTHYNIDGYDYYAVRYDAYLKKETEDVNKLNNVLEKIYVELNSCHRGNLRIFSSNTQGIGQWPTMTVPHFDFTEHIGEVVQTGTEYLKIYEEENKDFEFGHYPKNRENPHEFTQAGAYIRRKTSVYLYPNQYFAERQITSINADAVELMMYRMGLQYKHEKKEEKK